ncbi:MAG TPA: hypothetical protein VK576_07540, partial [Thermoleophilia bacterium]|nr:hypothetical protein [Thermoleophilia bacterium]
MSTRVTRRTGGVRAALLTAAIALAALALAAPAMAATPTGGFVSQDYWGGGPASGAGQFNLPSSLGLMRGSLYVADQGNNRVCMYSTDGAYLGSFGSWGTGDGQFESPWGLAVDRRAGL